MRSLLPEQRRVNGHDLIEGAIAEAHQHMLTQIGHGIGERLLAAAERILGRAPYVRRGHVSYSLEQTPPAPNVTPCRASVSVATAAACVIC